MADRDFKAKIGEFQKQSITFAGISMIILSSTAVAAFEAYEAHQLLAILLPVVVFFGINNDRKVQWNLFSAGLALIYYGVLACAGTHYLNGSFWPGLAYVAILVIMGLSMSRHR